MIRKGKKGSKQPRVCVYCLAPLTRRQKEHVIARQFFPKEPRWRDDLVTVPSCGRCNQEKQRVEDILGVLMPIGDTSEGARRVLQERVPRTLAKNRVLHRSLSESRVSFWLRHSSGILEHRRVLELSPWHQRAYYTWYQFVIKGLFWKETRYPLPAGFEIGLIKPTPGPMTSFLKDVFRRVAPMVRKRSLADGEFVYAFALADSQPVSLWWIRFRSTDMAVVTRPPGAGELRDTLRPIEWTPPPLPRPEPGLIVAPW